MINLLRSIGIVLAIGYLMYNSLRIADAYYYEQSIINQENH